MDDVVSAFCVCVVSLSAVRSVPNALPDAVTRHLPKQQVSICTFDGRRAEHAKSLSVYFKGRPTFIYTSQLPPSYCIVLMYRKREMEERRSFSKAHTMS